MGPVPRFDRYLLSQLLVHFGFFALVLVGVYWINRAVMLFDQLMGDGQSAMVFLEFSMLALPGVIKLVLPVAGFVATVYVANKLSTESELVVMQATGFSAFRMARPVAVFGVLVGLMMMALVHVLVPMSRATMIAERAALSENITARFLTEGQFTHPAKGVTFYMTEIDETGELRGLFVEDARSPRERTVFTARSALFVRGEAGPKLIMVDGMAQTLDRESGRMAVTRFSDFTYDLGALLTRQVGQRLRLPERVTTELLSADAGLLQEAGATAEEARYELHSRLAEPALSVAVVLIGFASLLLGGYSRLGLWRQIGLAVALLLAVQGLSAVAGQLGQQMAGGWVLAYVAPALGLASGVVLLWWAGRPRPVPKGAAA